MFPVEVQDHAGLLECCRHEIRVDGLADLEAGCDLFEARVLQRKQSLTCAASFLECAATTQRTVRSFITRVQVYTRTLRFMRFLISQRHLAGLDRSLYAVCSISFGFESHTARVFVCACDLSA